MAASWGCKVTCTWIHVESVSFLVVEKSKNRTVLLMKTFFRPWFLFPVRTDKPDMFATAHLPSSSAGFVLLLNDTTKISGYRRLHCFFPQTLWFVLDVKRLCIFWCDTHVSNLQATPGPLKARVISLHLFGAAPVFSCAADMNLIYH